MESSNLTPAVPSRGATIADDMHDPAWHSVGLESVARLRSMNPARAHFDHGTRAHKP